MKDDLLKHWEHVSEGLKEEVVKKDSNQKKINQDKFFSNILYDALVYYYEQLQLAKQINNPVYSTGIPTELPHDIQITTKPIFESEKKAKNVSEDDRLPPDLLAQLMQARENLASEVIGVIEKKALVSETQNKDFRNKVNAIYSEKNIRDAYQTVSRSVGEDTSHASMGLIPLPRFSGAVDKTSENSKNKNDSRSSQESLRRRLDVYLAQQFFFQALPLLTPDWYQLLAQTMIREQIAFQLEQLHNRAVHPMFNFLYAMDLQNHCESQEACHPVLRR